MRRYLVLLLFFLIELPQYSFCHSRYLRDTSSYPSKFNYTDGVQLPLNQIDSLVLKKEQSSKDSLKRIADSLAIAWIKLPDPNRPNKFMDSILDLYTVRNLDFGAWAKKNHKKVNRFNEGRLRSHGEKWVLGTILFLAFLLGLLKNVFPKEFTTIVQAFYNNRILGQINKEDNVLGSWPFIFMLLLFGLTIGMFFYLAGNFFLIKYAYDGVQWFLLLSAIIVALFVSKIFILSIFGFFFGIDKLVKEYISILYLSYFNASIIFIPLVIAFCLTPQGYAEAFIYLAIIILALMFSFQFLRAGANILTSYQFPKVYLILYLCALEICPLLILIKALKY